MIFYHFRGFRDILSIFTFRFVGVPRVFEKIEEGMKAAGAKSGLKKKVRKDVISFLMTELEEEKKSYSISSAGRLGEIGSIGPPQG